MSPAASDARPAPAILIHTIAIAGALFALDPGGRSLERYHLVKEAVLAGCAVALVVLAWARRRAVGLDALDAALVGLVAVDLAASIGVVDPDVARRSTLVSAALAGVALDLRGRAPLDRRWVGAIALGLCTLAAVVVVAESYALGPHLSLPSYAPGVTIGQRNNAGHVLAVALAGLAGAVLVTERLRPIALVPAIGLAAALILTRSRAAWLAALVGLAIAITASMLAGPPRRRTAGRVVVLCAAIALGMALPLAVRPSLAWRDASPYADTASRLLDAREGSGRGRLVQWGTSLALAAEDPILGVGPGHWALHYPRVAAEDDPTIHRDAWAPTSRLSTGDLVGWLVERGVLGLAVLLALLGLAARGLARERDAARLAALGALAVVSVLDCALAIATGALALALVLPARPGESAMHARTARAAAAIVALVVLAWGLAGTPRAIERAWIAHRAERAGLAEVQALAVRDPSNVTLRTRLAEHAAFTGGCASASRWLEELARLRPYHPRIVRERDGCRPR